MRLGRLIALVLIAAAPASAQSREFGIKAGPSFGMLSFGDDDEGGFERRVSADGGGFAVLPFRAPLALQLEALFTSKGASANDEASAANGAILLQYFDLPVLLRIEGPAVGIGRLHVFAGPFVGVRIGATRQVSYVSDSIRSGSKDDIGDEVEAFEAGWSAGGGVNLGNRLVIDGRYTKAMTPMNTDRTDGFEVRTHAVTIMAGVRF